MAGRLDGTGGRRGNVLGGSKGILAGRVGAEEDRECLQGERREYWQGGEAAGDGRRRQIGREIGRNIGRGREKKGGKCLQDEKGKCWQGGPATG